MHFLTLLGKDVFRKQTTIEQKLQFSVTFTNFKIILLRLIELRFLTACSIDVIRRQLLPFKI